MMPPNDTRHTSSYLGIAGALRLQATRIILGICAVIFTDILLRLRCALFYTSPVIPEYHVGVILQ